VTNTSGANPTLSTPPSFACRGPWPAVGAIGRNAQYSSKASIGDEDEARVRPSLTSVEGHEAISSELKQRFAFEDAHHITSGDLCVAANVEATVLKVVFPRVEDEGGRGCKLEGPAMNAGVERVPAASQHQTLIIALGRHIDVQREKGV